ncbi:hypothetical protein [Bosea sp. PAMC 26642]|uniref:hypothetical protein n=1 Tax=Bosea sp. (strain PAMC 26642) TaxID=1792307 RepID=UPI000770102E|nr:hypothetical protein [Bosea sp. PAMC 26642]AMJ62431.1 hypothetical protein AXW83_20920 [Bosea sp. PAMC 26642]
MTTDPIGKPPTDAPATYRTPQRPGQTGAQEQRRAGPNPLSTHATGPHAPYEKDDPDGFAAVKNAGPGEPEAAKAPPRKGLDGDDFTIIDGSARPKR